MSLSNGDKLKKNSIVGKQNSIAKDKVDVVELGYNIKQRGIA